MTGPGAAWSDEPARWTAPAGFRAPEPLGAEQGTAGERAGDAYEPPAGRPRQRGVRRVRRDTKMDEHVVERVEQLAELAHGGNYSAALQSLVERGLAELDRLAEAGLAAVDAHEQRRAAEAEVDRLTRPEVKS